VFCKFLVKPDIEYVVQLMRMYRYALSVDMVLVDYIQAIKGGDFKNKVEEVSHITSSLKRAAKDCGLALVVYSQYARDKYRNGQEPDINSFKYCGDIENESELVVLLWKDADKQLRAKVPKIKWDRSEQDSYLIPVDETTGCHKNWEIFDEKEIGKSEGDDAGKSSGVSS
jgi:replicative DNA helicase